MTKHRRIPKRKSKAAKPKAPEVKEVPLSPATILRIPYPSEVRPVVAVDSDKRVVEIVPVKVAPKKTWWQSLWE